MNDHRESGAPDLSALRIDPAERGSGGISRRWWIAAGAVAVLILLLIAAWASTRKVSVETATARPASGVEAATVLNASGYVTARRKATVAAKVTGRVSEVLVEEGMHVTEGQVLARLDEKDARASYGAAEANRSVATAGLLKLKVDLAEAEKELARTEALAASGYADQQSLDQARASVDGLKAQVVLQRDQVKAAEAQMAVAKRDIDNCVIRAPFAGVAVSKDAQPGEIVSPVSAGGGFTRTGISTIVDMSSLEIEVDVNESYIAKVEPGQEVAATLDAYPDWQIPCKVRTVIPTADRQKATVKVRIAFDRLDPRILPDMGAKVAFLNPEALRPGKAKALVPAAAVRTGNGGPVAFRVLDGRLRITPVKLGEKRGSEVEILDGLSPGDVVAVSGLDHLRDGQRVKAKGS
ncbi:MAG: efflux RND transporter periplasmic adaptor subunit [Acidobacteriota bacterium]